MADGGRADFAVNEDHVTSTRSPPEKLERARLKKGEAIINHHEKTGTLSNCMQIRFSQHSIVTKLKGERRIIRDPRR